MTISLEPLDCAPLIGATIRLEPLAESHLHGLLAAGGDPELWRWTVAQAGTPEKMRDYVGAALQWRAEGRVRDSVFFSLIAEEWPAVKLRLREKLAARGRVIP